jgi:transcriptional regulator with XRE-family HTH domain
VTPVCPKLANVLERFGLRLREVRLKAGVSQEKLAELAGLHRTYVSSVERGLRNISLENIDRLAAALDVELADLMPKREAAKKDPQEPDAKSRPARS